jgi:DNA-directed RNA polymerase subunit RPC12/RpoP
MSVPHKPKCKYCESRNTFERRDLATRDNNLNYQCADCRRLFAVPLTQDRHGVTGQVRCETR